MNLDAFGLHVGNAEPYPRCRELLGPFDQPINGSRYSWCVKREPHRPGLSQPGVSAVGCIWSTTHDRPTDLADWIRTRTARLRPPGSYGLPEARPPEPDDPPH